MIPFLTFISRAIKSSGYFGGVSDRKVVLPPIVFIHIQKTAGTSLINLLADIYHGELISHGDFQSYSDSALETCSLISGHFGYDYISKYVDERFVFTFLRNPVQRVLSLYFFCRSQADYSYPIYRLAKKYSLVDFLKCCSDEPVIRRHVWNHQVWSIAKGRTKDSQDIDWNTNEILLLDQAKENLMHLDFFGFTESYQEDVSSLMSSLGFSNNWKLARDNQSVYGDRKSLNSKEEQLLGDITALDMEFYNWALANRREPKRIWNGNFYE